MTHTHNGLNAHVLFAVADALEAEAFIIAGRSKLYFNMGSYVAVRRASKHTCGSTACIAGWVVSMFDENGAPREKTLTPTALRKLDDSAKHELHNIHYAAMRTIGLDEHEANMLFSPGCLSAITPKIAAETLRNLALTGEIEWNL